MLQKLLKQCKQPHNLSYLRNCKSKQQQKKPVAPKDQLKFTNTNLPATTQVPQATPETTRSPFKLLLLCKCQCKRTAKPCAQPGLPSGPGAKEPLPRTWCAVPACVSTARCQSKCCPQSRKNDAPVVWPHCSTIALAGEGPLAVPRQAAPLQPIFFSQQKKSPFGECSAITQPAVSGQVSLGVS